MKYFKMTIMPFLLLGSFFLATAEARETIRSESRSDSRHQGRPSNQHNNHHSNHHQNNHNHHYNHHHRPYLRHGHTHYRVFIAPYWWYYPRTYHHYYYSTPVVVTPPPSPPEYIEQGNGDAAYWHYCSNPEGYYPYIKECPGGWQKVVPQAPPS